MQHLSAEYIFISDKSVTMNINNFLHHSTIVNKFIYSLLCIKQVFNYFTLSKTN